MPHNTRLEHIFHLYRAVRYRLTTVVGRWMLRGLHIEYGPQLTLKGLPIVKCAPGSSVVLGRQVMLISSSGDTALAVNHPVKIETTAPGARITIGDQVGMSGGTLCAAAGITLGERTLLGANVTVVDTDFHPLAARERWRASDEILADPVIIGQNVFLGTGALVLRGVHIGDNTVVGAGSVVTSSLPANAIATGNPCRVLRLFTPEEISKINQVDAGA